MTIKKSNPFHVQEMALVESRLQESNATGKPCLSSITGYILSEGGKRIRPLLVLLCSDIYGSPLETRIDVAVATELIHSASLLHDDVVDSSPLRRGKPSANECWGNPTAVLAGDFLFARAYSLLSRYPEILDIMTEAIATMCLGELNQLYTHFDINTTPEQYINTIVGKTASLLTASCECGAAISTMPATEKRLVCRFALHLGIAYQILDDISDYVLEASQSGKPRGSDIRNGIVTLPLMYLLANPDTRTRAQSLLRERQPIEPKMLAPELAESGAIDKAVAIGRHHLDHGKELLHGLPSGKPQSQLVQLTDYFLKRCQFLSETHSLSQKTSTSG